MSLNIRSFIIKIANVCLIGVVSVVACSSFASDVPVYSAGKLLVPAVQANGKPGFFQDVVIESAGNNLWRVSELYEGIPIRDITQVELIKSGSAPVQVFLKISGTFTSGCPEFGDVSTMVEGSQFSVIAYYKLNKHPPGSIVCTAALVPFSQTIPLSVYGLDSGTYSYTVNGKFTGTFVLDSKNSL